MNGSGLQQAIGVAWQVIQRVCSHTPLMFITVAIASCLWVGLLGPPDAYWPLAGCLVVGCCSALWYRKRYLCLGLLCSAFSLWHAHHARWAVLPETLLNRPLLIEGRVVAIHTFADYQSAVVVVDECHLLDVEAVSCTMIQKVQLALSPALGIKQGERWRMQVHLKPPHGMANPDQWDTVWRQRRQGIGAVGSLLPHTVPQRLSMADWQPAVALRQQIEASGISAMGQRWLIGMVVGDGSAFDDTDWQLFNDTGTTHLVVVSGSHITLAVGFVASFGLWCTRYARPKGYRRMVSPRVVASIAGISYALLAQGGAPAARACVALLPWVLAIKTVWRPSRWQLWWLALAGVLLVLPWSFLMPGVWLSFGAVAGLYLMHPQHEKAPSLRRLLICHALITLLMEGALLVMMARWAPLSFPANLIAIPWVSLLLMPLGMLGVLCVWPCPYMAHLCWWLFDKMLVPLCALLRWAAGWCPAQLLDPRPAMVVGVALIGLTVTWMLPCCRRRWRYALSAVWVMMVIGRSSPPPLGTGQFALTVLDVGQGQMVEIRTQQHRYLFDTGPERYTGQRAIDDVWPAAQLFDGVIVSHADMDHSGGIPTLRQHHHVVQWWVPWVFPSLTVQSDSSGPAVSPLLCRAGQTWDVDGVQFHFLWPLPEQPLADTENDRSCVLMVEGRDGRALLSGDATERVEQQLLGDFDRPISIWVAGHHGSHSSNSRALLIRARPTAMLYSAGYANRYHHPSPQTVERVRDVGADQWNTADAGAIDVQFLPQGALSITPRRGQRAIVRRRL